MNTRVTYMYRDASNYKESKDVIFVGEVARDEKLYLETTDEFIAAEVGLESLQPLLTSFPSEDDHVYHEVSSVEATDEAPTDSRTIQEFVGELLARPDDVAKAMADLGIF
jgi:hypothetical protein